MGQLYDKITNKASVDTELLAIVFAFVFFWGEPDIVDSGIAALQALARYLTSITVMQ